MVKVWENGVVYDGKKSFPKKGSAGLNLGAGSYRYPKKVVRKRKRMGVSPWGSTKKKRGTLIW